ncbi:MAG: CRISPR-associated protein Cas4 [Bryobacteraceae bacterium]
MTYSEVDLLPLSGLQHLLFCERQWGLIHIEQQWAENQLTAEGRILHDRVHEAGTDARVDVVTARGLHLHSFRLGLTGQADAVEFHRVPEGPPRGALLDGREGWWRPLPVEYKRGRPKANLCDEVQLCAQAICMEEMLGVEIERGALYYGANRRRKQIEFTGPLRVQTEDLAGRMHRLYAAKVTPTAVYAKKCGRCSLIGQCLPRAVSKRDAVKRYLLRALRDEEAAP